MWKKTFKLDNKNIYIAAFVCVCMFLAGLAATVLIDELLVERSFTTMTKLVRQMSLDFQNRVEADRDQMKMMATMLSLHKHTNMDVMQDHMEKFPMNNAICSYAILLPDNTLIMPKNAGIHFTKRLNFETESRNTATVKEFFTREGENYIAYEEPILENGQTAAILLGFVKQADLSRFFKDHAFNDSCKLYLINGMTDHYWVDTFHNYKEGKVISDFVSVDTSFISRLFNGRKAVVEDRSHFSVYESESTGEMYYSYYQPIGVDNLILMVTLPESEVFADATNVKRVVHLLSLLQALLCAGYIAYMLWRYKRRVRLYGHIVEEADFVHEIQQLLFGAYREPYCISAAMHMLAERTGAQLILCSGLKRGRLKNVFCWPMQEKDILEYMDRKNCPSDLIQTLQAGRTIVFTEDDKTWQHLQKEMGVFPDMHIRNALFIPIKKNDVGLIGLFAGFNLTNPLASKDMLEGLTDSLMMSMQNVEAYRAIQKLGIVDELTGLRNRNAYQTELPQYEQAKDDFTIVYMDVNGLHELNNTLGHEAGDKMLMAVADAIVEEFGRRDSYRFGGDEFISFVRRDDEAAVASSIMRIKERLQREGYYISAGWDVCRDRRFMQRSIIEAEKKMYEDKERYYNSIGKNKKKRVINEKLEHFLTEKRDQDSFLRVIASDFLGVYAVNLNTDDTRVICKPDYFKTILEENKYRYRNSIREYARLYVSDESKKDFAIAYDYKAIEQQLEESPCIEFTYTKTDGLAVRIRIFKAEDYDVQYKNTLWIFEKLKKAAPANNILDLDKKVILSTKK